MLMASAVGACHDEAAVALITILLCHPGGPPDVCGLNCMHGAVNLLRCLNLKGPDMRWAWPQCPAP
jgi:hypothetical protein